MTSVATPQPDTFVNWVRGHLHRANNWRKNNGDRVSKIASWACILIALTGVAIGWISQQNTIDQLQAESANRAQSTCVTETKFSATIERIIVFATAPVSTIGLDPDRVPAIEALNAARFKAREEILALIPEPTCPKGTSPPPSTTT